MFPLLVILTVISAITMSFAGALSLVRNPSRNEHRWFFAFSLALAIWIVANFIGSNVVQPFITSLFVKMDFTFALISSWLFLQFSAVLVMSNPFYQGQKRIEANARVFRYTSLVAVAVICLGIARGIVFKVLISGGNLTVKVLEGYWLYVAVLTLLILYSFLILLAGYREIAKKDRQGIEIIVAGLTVFSITNLTTNLIFPLLIDDRVVVKRLNIIGYLGIAFLILCIYTAITMKKLFDIKAGAIRGAVYLFSVSMVGLVYVSPIAYIVGIKLLGLPYVWYKFFIIVLVGTLGAVYFNQVKTWFDQITRKLFFQNTFEPAAIIAELNKVLVSSGNLNEIMTQTEALIHKNFQTEQCIFVLKDIADNQLDNPSYIKKKAIYQSKGVTALLKGNYTFSDIVISLDVVTSVPESLRSAFAKSGVSVIVRLTQGSIPNKENIIGYILLGYKKNGSPYVTRDIKTLEAMADVLVIAIQNALRFEEIQNFNRTLQRTVDERTRQLKRTNAKLVLLDETKDDFISMASHQLRTPLTSVKGYLSMVLDGDAGAVRPMQRKMLDQAFVSSQRMVYLIADLLNVSRLKTGKFVIEPSAVNLVTLVSDEIKQLQETARSHSLTLEFIKPAQFPDLMFDETKIRQVIMNFIDNAIYYTPAGGNIRVELVDTPVSVKLLVTDTGIGVPKAEQPHLFTKFYRAGNARRARPDGTGLGLFMAKKVVIASGGSIVFESREGKGSMFGFVFAKEKIAVPVAAPSVAPKVRETARVN